jgi:hypothetical protein
MPLTLQKTARVGWEKYKLHTVFIVLSDSFLELLVVLPGSEKRAPWGFVGKDG